MSSSENPSKVPTSRDEKTKKSSSTSFVAIAAAGCVLAVCLGSGHVHYRKQGARNFPPLVQQQQQQAAARAGVLDDISKTNSLHRDLLAETINDDITRDETCKAYMSQFLDGTTDFKDECQGMYNAYQAADCVDDSHLLNANNKTSHDDDIAIDDFYEKWECCSSIYDYYSKHCHEPKLDSPRLLGIVFVLLLCGFMKGMIRALGMGWIPDAAACIIVGAITGAAIRVVSPDLVQEHLTFNGDFFLHILLPPIVFQASLQIDKRAFSRDLFPILTFAIFGTILSAVAVGYITHYLTPIPLLDSLMFGALISSIDPVATLGVLSGVGVNPTETLYTLTFGESLLNDGVAIVFFDTLVEHLGDKTVVDQATLWEIVTKFLWIAFGSIFVGVVCGCCCTLYFWALWGKHTAVMEVSVFFTWALIPFYISDAIGCSGIIAIMVMGFVLDYYVIGGFQSEDAQWMGYMQLRAGSSDDLMSTSVEIVSTSNTFSFRMGQVKQIMMQAFSGRGHILSRSRHHVGFVADVIATIMETAIFAYLGVFLFNDNETWDFQFNAVAIFGCVSSRTVMVMVFSALINLCVLCDVEATLGRTWTRVFRPDRLRPVGGFDDEDDDTIDMDEKKFLDGKTQLILVLAGVRGAVSFALAANIPVYDVVTKHGSQFKAELKAMTSSTIFLTIFVMGALTYFTVSSGVAASSSVHSRGNRNPLQERLLSAPLHSDIGDSENESNSTINASANALEIESSAIGLSMRGRIFSE